VDDRRFDDLTRDLATNPASRRGMLRLLAGGTLAGLFAAQRTEEAAAACGKVGDKCRRRRDCCSGAICGEDKKCACPVTSTDCNGRCISDFMSNPRHCGNCNRRCAEGVSCTDGRCLALTCPKGSVVPPCGQQPPTMCHATEFCFCVRRAEGGRACSANFLCADPSCSTDADCEGETFCAEIEGCCNEATIRRCVKPCGGATA
jgi:hypothetical protein